MSGTLTVLGCDGSYPGPGGAGSGYLLQTPATAIALDLGPGTLARLQLHCSLAALDAVVVSHEHPDHRSDLESLCLAVADLGRPPLAVYATAGARDAFFFPRRGELEWNVVSDGEEVRVGDVALSFSRTDHGPETLAVRADLPGGSLAYSADTGPGWSVAALGAGIGLFLCEATWDEEHRGGESHLSGAEAGAMAKAAGVGRLVVTHIRPSVQPGNVVAQAAAAFGGPVEQATPGAVYHI